jgi:hypothetical protein
MEDMRTLDMIEAMRSQKGAMNRLKAKDKTESQPAAAAAGSGIARLGPRGGLPRTKPELQQLARDLGVDPSGTVEELKNKLCDTVTDLKTPAPLHPTTSPTTRPMPKSPVPVPKQITRSSVTTLLGSGGALADSSGGRTQPSHLLPEASWQDDNMLLDGEMLTEEELAEFDLM